MGYIFLPAQLPNAPETSSPGSQRNQNEPWTRSKRQLEAPSAPAGADPAAGAAQSQQGTEGTIPEAIPAVGRREGLSPRPEEPGRRDDILSSSFSKEGAAGVGRQSWGQIRGETKPGQ